MKKVVDVRLLVHVAAVHGGGQVHAFENIVHVLFVVVMMVMVMMVMHHVPDRVRDTHLAELGLDIANNSRPRPTALIYGASRNIFMLQLPFYPVQM